MCQFIMQDFKKMYWYNQFCRNVTKFIPIKNLFLTHNFVLTIFFYHIFFVYEIFSLTTIFFLPKFLFDRYFLLIKKVCWPKNVWFEFFSRKILISTTFKWIQSSLEFDISASPACSKYVQSSSYLEYSRIF